MEVSQLGKLTLRVGMDEHQPASLKRCHRVGGRLSKCHGDERSIATGVNRALVRLIGFEYMVQRPVSQLC